MLNKNKIKGCGKIFHQDKDDYYSESCMRWCECSSKCGETFDEKGIDLCRECKK